MQAYLLASLMLTAACTTSSTSPSDELYGTWERTNALGAVIDSMTFGRDGTFTATAATNPESPTNSFGDLRDVHGSFSADAELVHLRGTTGDDMRFEIDFTYFADDTHFIRGAFLLNQDETEHGGQVRHYYALHARDYNQTFERELNVGLQLIDQGDNGWYGASFEDPIWGGPDGEGGSWSLAPDGGAIILERGDRYETFGANGIEALGRFDMRAATLEAPGNLWDTAYIFTRGN